MKVFLSLSVVAVSYLAWGVQYRVVDLGVLPLPMRNSVAYGMNDLGTVVGRSNSGSGWPFAWTAESGMRRLGSMAAWQDQGEARDVNNSGVVCGWVNRWFNGRLYLNAPMTWTAQRGINFLPSPNGVFGSAFPERINDRGYCAGYIHSEPAAAVLWPVDGQPFYLGELEPGLGAAARGLNNDRVVVGAAGVRIDLLHNGATAFVWDAERGMRNLGLVPPYDQSWAWDVNDGGTIVGEMGDNESLRFAAFIVRPGHAMEELGYVPGQTQNEAFAINNKGQVTGVTFGPNGYNSMFLYEPGAGMVDLQTLLEIGSLDWQLAVAFDINEHGDLAGAALKDGIAHAVLVQRL